MLASSVLIAVLSVGLLPTGNPWVVTVTGIADGTVRGNGYFIAVTTSNIWNYNAENGLKYQINVNQDGTASIYLNETFAGAVPVTVAGNKVTCSWNISVPDPATGRNFF